MKRFASFLFTATLLLAMSVTAFAASSDTTLTYTLLAEDSDSIVVQTGDIVTVEYYLSADDAAVVSAIQDEIYYDDTFFEFVEDSNESVYTDYATTVLKRLNGNWYVYFNTAQTRTHQEQTLIGSFDLKVIATSGNSTVSNTNYEAYGLDNVAFGAISENLLVSIGEEQVATYTVDFLDSSNDVYTSISATAGETITMPDGPSRSGYSFSYWYVSGDTSTKYYEGDSYTVASDMTFTSKWSSTSSGGSSSSTTYYTITSSANDGGSISPNGSTSVASGNSKTYTITADSGYAISDVEVDGDSVGAVSSYQFTSVSSAHTIEAFFEESDSGVVTYPVADPDDTGVSSMLQTEEHIKYMNGFTDGSFGPTQNMTRAQAAQMFYNLLLDTDVESTESFSDVPEDMWCAEAVYTLASLGIVTGYTDGTYGPDKNITRAEFCVIAMRFAEMSYVGENNFSDVADDAWYIDHVISAVSYGWINGYTDGTFGPTQNITRAEVTTVVNRMLGRSADVDFVDDNGDLLTSFTDLSSTYWAYYNIMEATNGHDYYMEDSAEVWTDLH